MMPYIIHVAVIIAACFVFYKLLLQKETFYRINRFVLLACLIFSFSLPLVPVPQQFSFREAEISEIITDESIDPSPAINVNIENTPTIKNVDSKTEASTFNLSKAIKWMIWLYWFGVIAFAINLIVQVAVIFYRIYSNPFIKNGKFRIVEMRGDKAPCSFGNAIFINPEKYDWETYNQIILHEKVHIQQGHSYDILLAEIALVFQWFNPFAWQYRKELETNLEFLTDDQLLQHAEIEKSSYQMSLLKVSAPQLPLSLTTNYNASLLKKRLVMMNSKKSNVHTGWKYLFLFPLLLASIFFFNKPATYAQTVKADNNQNNTNTIQATEGLWFADIKNNGIQINFKREGYTGNGLNGTIFKMNEFKDLPRDKEGSFKLNREAGTIEFTGKFDGNQGMGRYRFIANEDYKKSLQKEGIDLTDDVNQMTFFFVDVKQEYVKMLKEAGFKIITKNDLIPMSALEVDKEYIQSIKEAGFSNISMQNLVAFKSLGVDESYIKEIRKSGYSNVTASQIISFKATGVDKKYIADVNEVLKNTKPGVEAKERQQELPEEKFDRQQLNDDTNIDDYVRSLRDAGFTDITSNKIADMKAAGITADYIKQWQVLGYAKISASDLIALKANKVSPEFARSFEQVGYYHISPAKISGMRALGITPELVKEYNELGFQNISLGSLMGAKGSGVTPEFIKTMRAKGHDLTLSGYIQVKNAFKERGIKYP